MNRTTPELKSHLLLDQTVMSGPDGETWMTPSDFELFGKPGKRRFLQVSDERLEGGREYIVSVRPNDRVMIGDGLGDEPEAMTPFADWVLDGWPQIRAAKTKLWFRWVAKPVAEAPAPAPPPVPELPPPPPEPEPEPEPPDPTPEVPAPEKPKEKPMPETSLWRKIIKQAVREEAAKEIAKAPAEVRILLEAAVERWVERYLS